MHADPANAICLITQLQDSTDPLARLARVIFLSAKTRRRSAIWRARGREGRSWNERADAMAKHHAATHEPDDFNEYQNIATTRRRYPNVTARPPNKNTGPFGKQLTITTTLHAH
eukprot:7128916-Pyramimonas_sp.AAC.1